MCIWNKILLGLISVASVVLFYMAARAVKTETEWSKLALQYEQKIEQLNRDNRTLMEGTEGQPGIRQTRMELYKLAADRRRVWSKCDPSVKVGQEGTAEITVAIDQTAPLGIIQKSVLYAFDAADVQHDGQYLGEFTVTNINDKQVTLVPTSRLDPREISALEKANKRPWVLYEILPQDKQKKQDYSILFADERAKRNLLVDSIKDIRDNKQLVAKALAEARNQEDACNRDVALAQADKRKVIRERDAVVALCERLETNLGKMQAWIADLTKANQAKAGQIAKSQLEAAERIDQRTRAMAQSGAGRR